MPLINGDTIIFDTEATGINLWHGDRPFMYGLENMDGDRVIVEFEVDPTTRRPKYTRSEVRGLKEVLEDPKRRIVMHNANYDRRAVLLANGIDIRNFEDTLFMAHAVYALELSYTLKDLGWKYCDIPRTDESDLKEAVKRARRIATRECPTWKIGWEYKIDAFGQEKKKGLVESDYWLPAALHRIGKMGAKEAGLCEDYCGWDLTRTRYLFMLLEHAVQVEEVVEQYRREKELFWVVDAMETRGVYLSKARNSAKIVETKRKLAQYRAEVESAAWEGFNIQSNTDLATLFFKKHGLTPTTITKNKTKDKNLWPDGVPSVSGDVLEEHLDDELVRSHVKFKSQVKGLGTYFNNYRRMKLPDPYSNGHCIRPSFRQCGPVTGRFSCANPNLQNVADPEASKAIEPIAARTPFGPRPGYWWYCLDYSQLEAVLFASIANEPTMLAAIKNGEDLHTIMTNRAFGGVDNPAAVKAAMHTLRLDGSGEIEDQLLLDLYKTWQLRPDRRPDSDRARLLARDWLASFEWNIVEAEESVGKKITRGKCKICTFCRIYGGGPKAAARQINCSEAEARTLWAEYGQAFPRVDRYLKEAASRARRVGYVRTKLGRRINVPKNKAYRAVNYETQGGAADLLKVSMIRCHEYLQSIVEKIDTHIVLTVHDEIVFETPAPGRKGVIMQLADIMEDHMGAFGDVKLSVSIARCVRQWDQKEKMRWRRVA